MKKIQKIINSFKYSDSTSRKQIKSIDTKKYLVDSRRQYVSAAPVGFKSRSGSEFFLQ
ncbi:MAG: hypothetical protein WCP56_02205 [Candidatus Saccharibacteria bacterium]|jgi:hypothetical protein|nr:hypothetical protein [Patescibacteria group bacterium]